MAYPCWRDWSETSNVLFVNKPIVRVVAFCRFEDHLNSATRDVDLEIALSGSFHLRLYGPSRQWSGSLAMFAAILRASSFVSSLAADRRSGSKRLNWCSSYQALKVWRQILWLHWISDRLAPIPPSIWSIRDRACGAAHRPVC